MADSYKEFDKSPIVDDAVSFHGYSFKKREIALGGVALVALVVCVILAALLASAKSGGGVGDLPGTACGQTGAQTQGMCLTPTCMKSAAYALESMNSTIDPCDNFYQYACGTWARNNPLKPDVSQLTPSWNIYYKNQEKLRRLVETPTSRTSSWASEKKLKDFFTSCTDHYGKMILQGNPFLDQVVAKAGGWYVIGTWNESTYDFEDSLRKTHVDFWTNAFFTFSVRTDWLDWRKIAIQIDLSGTGISWIYYVRPDGAPFIVDYKRFMRTVAGYLVRDSGVSINATEKQQRIDTFVDDVFLVESTLANITSSSDPSEDPHDHQNRVKLRDLNTMTNTAIDWVQFFTYMFSDAGVNADTKVVLLESDYIKKMAAFITNLGDNKSRILNNYLVWRLAHKYVQDLSWDYIHANREFYVDMTGEAEFLGTWRYCIGIVDRDMGEAMSALFVKDHFSDANKDKSAEIVNYLRTALVDSLTSNQWMDENTRNIAKKKITDSIYKMGYPDYMMSDDKLDQMYMALKIDRYDYFANRMSMNKFYKIDWNRRLKHGTDTTEWTYNTYSVIAEYYNPWKEMIVPAGLLQWPLYDHKLPHYMNFGALGTILGHNLIHAVDQTGAQYKIDGSHFGDWWTNSTKKSYIRVRQCVIDAYANRTMGPFTLTVAATDPIAVPVDAPGYAPEALAETSGVRLAYKAFKAWEKANKVERTAPGAARSNDQMFFVAYAQSNCFNRNPNEAFSQAARGILQESLKVNMAVSQVPEFREAFKCPSNSKMVAKKTCTMY
ncbi:endothelin-converting enzyme 1-like [Haliotis rufescens]|uniref:endothelin-converting enzyme 1-like n=1 Tax=Haliotis rufescens TaxID=6454 RepID=UPI00201F5901|nr:endothelin-converting enzyme 1-like [Haliotis rufescens]